MTPEPQPRPTRRKEDRPEEIAQAAMEVFVETGFANATINEIAKRAGAAKGTVYLYYETKDDLFEAVVRRFVKPIFAKIDQLAVDFEGSTRELLTAVILKAYDHLVGSVQRRAILKILISEGDRFPQLTKLYHEEVISSAEEVMRRILQRGIDSGEFRETVPLTHPQVIVGPILMAVVWKLTFERIEPLDVEKFSAAHLDVLFEGLLSRKTA